MERFHFHRQEHHPQHDNQYSAPALNATIKTRGARKYVLPERPVSIPAAGIALKSPDSDTADIFDLSNAMRCTAISPTSSSKPYQNMSPASLNHLLHNWKQDKKLIAESRERERYNPFPDLDLNEGWTRARCEVKMHFQENFGEIEEKVRIQKVFKGYSLWAQLDPLELESEELKGVFHMIFVGDKSAKEGWARIPGSWWAERKHLFVGDKGVTYEEAVAAKAVGLYDKIEQWKINEKRGKTGLKRKRSIVETRRRKRAFQLFGKPRKVMGETWRAKRRVQEKKAGRWTDGTIGMDRMWDGFHWVLDEDNWRNQMWAKCMSVKKVQGSDIWG